jgi:hypothetical protein
MGFFPDFLPDFGPGSVIDRLKETAAPGPFSRRALYEETKRIAAYAGMDLTERDSTVVFLDWDDTLFPSTWVQRTQRRCEEAGRPVQLSSHPKMQELCAAIKSLLAAVSRVGHVFIVTAASKGFVRKCCRICFPELLKVLDDLQVKLIYARPQGDAELDEPIEKWKEAAFRKILQAPHERPLPPQLARFYDSPGWKNVISYGDQWTDHTAVLRAAGAFEVETATVKAHGTEEGLEPGALARELRGVCGLLPSLVGPEAGRSYDLYDPDVRCRYDLPSTAAFARSGRSAAVVPESVAPVAAPFAAPFALDPQSPSVSEIYAKHSAAVVPGWSKGPAEGAEAPFAGVATPEKACCARPGSPSKHPSRCSSKSLRSLPIYSGNLFDSIRLRVKLSYRPFCEEGL